MDITRLRATRGFTLVEVLVASALFLFIALAALSVFNDANKVYKAGDSSAEMQQRTRLAFDVMLDELRRAGFDYNRDGDANPYPDATDEQIEYVGAHAITIRGNLDYGDASTGRESAYELHPGDTGYGTSCCPIVTTANDEIVTYALRSDDSSKNVGTIALKVDTSQPRNAGRDNTGAVVGEETVRITNVDLTGNNPPYTLMRFSLDDQGAVVEQLVAASIRNMTFTYEGSDGLQTWCPSPASDGSCPTGTSVDFATLGGGDDRTTGDGQGRSGRSAIRRFNVELVGMTAIDQPRYVDRTDTKMPGRRKLVLDGTVVPQNLGLKGQPDITDVDASVPTNVTVCADQCNTIRVEWDDMSAAASYYVKLYLGSATSPFFTGSTPGVSIPDTVPPRVYAVYQRTDHASIVNGAVIHAVVQSRTASDRTSDNSIASSSVTLRDVVKLEGPKDVKASGYDPTVSGWPDLAASNVVPLTSGTSAYKAQADQILVSWAAPTWNLQVTNAGDPANSWTTRVGSGAVAPSACDREMADTNNDGSTDTLRTRARDLIGATRYLLFRSTDPHFVPTAADFLSSTSGTVDVLAGRVTYLDSSVHVYTNGMFNSTQHYLVNCTPYYYRVRAVDDCWSGTNPASLTDPHISPFSPPLNTASSASNSDDTTSLAASEVGLAIPGFAVPEATPQKPTTVRFTNYDRSTTDGDGKDATIGFDASKMDTFVASSQPAYDDITIAQYQVWSSPQQNFTLSDILSGGNGTQLEATIDVRDLYAGRISYDDENGDGSITSNEDETVTPSPWPSGALPRTGLRIVLPNGTASRWYRVMAMQCRTENTVPSTSDYTSLDTGVLSDALKFPCDFGGGPYSTITVNSTSFPTSVTTDAIVQDVTVTAPRARLILKDPRNGDRVMSAQPGVASTTPALGSFHVVFNQALIASLTDNFGNGTYRIITEWDDSNGCLGISDAGDQGGTLPSCCLSASPTFTRPTTTRVLNTVTESCGTSNLRINKVTINVDNANGGQPERFQSALWNGTAIWSGNATNTVIDRSANPLTIAAYGTAPLQLDLQRAVSGDLVSVVYDYKVGGQTGTCTFSMRIP